MYFKIGHRLGASRADDCVGVCSIKLAAGVAEELVDFVGLALAGAFDSRGANTWQSGRARQRNAPRPILFRCVGNLAVGPLTVTKRVDLRLRESAAVWVPLIRELFLKLRALEGFHLRRRRELQRAGAAADLTLRLGVVEHSGPKALAGCLAARQLVGDAAEKAIHPLEALGENRSRDFGKQRPHL